MRWLEFVVCLALALLAMGCSEVSLAGNDFDPEQSTDEPESLPVDLHDLGQAPELTNEVWLNTPEPLRLADLRGQVVLLEFWTFG